MPSVVAFETFDIASERPFSRERIHPQARSAPGAGATFSQKIDERSENLIEVVVKTGNRSKLRRLLHLYNATILGTMPMNYTHPELGSVLVVFEDPEEIQQLQSYANFSTTIRLRVWEGGYG